MSTKNTSKTRGRPRAKINFPKGEFTIPQLSNRYTKVTKVCIFNHVKRAIKSQLVKRVGKKPLKGRGHPIHIFTLTNKGNVKFGKNVAPKAAPVAEMVAA